MDFNQHPIIKLLVVNSKMTHSILSKLVLQLRHHELNQTEFLVLYALAVNDRLTIQDIGERIAITSGSMTYTIDKLEGAGLIVRQRCLEDRRRIYIAMTPAGRVLWDQVISEHMAYLDQMFEAIPQEDIALFTSLAKKIGKNVK